MKMRMLGLAMGATLLAMSACGCASHTTNGKTHTVVLGGLVDIQDGAYEAPPQATLALQPEAPLPGSKLTGNKVSILWGLISFRDQ
jgi:hypothetical protein